MKVTNFEDLDRIMTLLKWRHFVKRWIKTISVATAVATISAAVGTHTIIPTWQQGSWNNMLYNSRGPEVELFYRNTWESWDRTFSEILRKIL